MDSEDHRSTHHWQSKALAQQEIGEGSVLDDTEFYDDVGVPNYQLIGDYNKNDPLNHSYMDITSARYLEIGGTRKSTISSLGSYDDIRAPDLPTSSRIYLSADNLSLVQYDDIKARERLDDEAMCLEEDEEEEELHSSALVTATPCVVLEEQMDSLSYVYDDIGRREEVEEEGGEMGLYESIAGSLLNLARAGTSDSEDFSLGRRLSRDVREPHEVVSYSLGDLDESFRGSSRSSCTIERKSVTSESSEWVDIETGEYLKSCSDRLMVIVLNSLLFWID